MEDQSQCRLRFFKCPTNYKNEENTAFTRTVHAYEVQIK